MSNKTLGVIGAMDSELSLLCSKLQDPVQEQRGGLCFHVGQLGSTRVILVKSGVGKVYAARCAQLLIDFYHPDLVVNTGIAGGIGQGLRVGDVVIATGLVQHDFDVTAFGYARGNFCDHARPEWPTIFPCDESAIGLLDAASASCLAADRIHHGVIATGDVFVSSQAQKLEIAHTFQALAAEMEGGAIAQVANANGTPVAVLRAISDLADGTAPASFDAFEQQTADLSAAILEQLALRF